MVERWWGASFGAGFERRRRTVRKEAGEGKPWGARQCQRLSPRPHSGTAPLVLPPHCPPHRRLEFVGEQRGAQMQVDHLKHRQVCHCGGGADKPVAPGLAQQAGQVLRARWGGARVGRVGTRRAGTGRAAHVPGACIDAQGVLGRTPRRGASITAPQSARRRCARRAQSPCCRGSASTSPWRAPPAVAGSRKEFGAGSRCKAWRVAQTSTRQLVPSDSVRSVYETHPPCTAAQPRPPHQLALVDERDILHAQVLNAVDDHVDLQACAHGVCMGARHAC